MVKKIRRVLDYVLMLVALGLEVVAFRELYHAYLALGPGPESVVHVFISVFWLLLAGVALILSNFVGYTKEERKRRKQAEREWRAERMRRELRHWPRL